jgi:hypothetical protein
MISQCEHAQCEHCGVFIAEDRYRVTSFESGVKLLDMIVCHACFIESQKLGLQAEKIKRVALIRASQFSRSSSLRALR